MSRILVAGAAGLLGSAIAAKLLENGETVVAVDVFDDSGDGRAPKEERAVRLREHARATIRRSDLNRPEAADALLAEFRPAAVVNAARFAPTTNGALPLIGAAARAGVELFVHLSAAALYGPAPEPGRRAREEEPVEPGADPELRLRAAEEEALRSIGPPFVILRVFELLGPSLPVSRFPMDALEALLADDELPPLDDQPRDFLHLDDAARGAALALERRPAGRTVNLGSGGATLPWALVEALAHGAGVSPRPGRTASSRARPPRIADMENAWSLLGFSPSRGTDAMVDEILAARLADVHKPAPAPPPARHVSRRELFDLFRRPLSRPK